MDGFVELLVEQLRGHPTISLIVAALVFGVIAMPRLLDLWHAFVDFRAGTRERLTQKETLELLKLQCEIAAIRKQHGLTIEEISAEAPAPLRTRDFASSENTDLISGPLEPAQALPSHDAEASQPPELWPWLRRIQDLNHTIARSLIGVAAVVFTLLATFGFLVALVMFTLETDSGLITKAFALGLVLLLSPLVYLLNELIRQDTALIKRHAQLKATPTAS